MVYNKCSTLIIVLLLLIPCATPLTFDFPSFSDTDNTSLSREGAVFVENKLLRFTEIANVSDVGRVTYKEPFILRDNTTGHLADFNSSFTFIINSRNTNGSNEDGIAFFLAPLGIPSLSNNSSARNGGRLGLAFNNTLSNEYPYVAVEFVFGHVGIDVNSIDSVTTKPWYASTNDDKPLTSNSAKVSYNSGTKNLSVAFTTYDELKGTQVISSLSCKLDLTKYLPDRIVAGFSASSTGNSIDVISWNFTSTNLVDENDTSLVVPPTPDLGSKVKPRRKRKTHVAVVIGSIVGGCMLVGVLGVGVFNSCKRNENRDNTKMGQNTIKGLRRFSYEEIALATRKFADGEKLGEDEDGVFYRGFRYDMNSYVTVKRISKLARRVGYESWLRIMSLMNHKNVMNLIGWCDHQGDLLLVFEFMPKGTLDSYFVKSENSLSWEVRYKIAQQLAETLAFMHATWEPDVHSNIRSSNIMLDSNFTPKLGNILLRESPIGDLYRAPGYLEVNSFGVVALEIACGRTRKSFDGSFEEGSQCFLTDWVWELYREGKIIEAADPKLRGEFDKEQMECLLVVGLWCARLDFSFSPSFDQVLQVLNSNAPSLPLLIMSEETAGSSSERTTNESYAIYSCSTGSSSRWGQIDQTRISAKQRWRRLYLAFRFLGRLKRVNQCDHDIVGVCDGTDATSLSWFSWFGWHNLLTVGRKRVQTESQDSHPGIGYRQADHTNEIILVIRKTGM